METLVLEKVDLKYTYTTKIYPYVNKLLTTKVMPKLNKILYNYFNADTILSCLLNNHRRNSNGFNLTFTIHYLIYLINQRIDIDLEKIKSKKQKIPKDSLINQIIMPVMEQFILHKQAKNFRQTNFSCSYTIKLQAFMHKICRDLVDNLNILLNAGFTDEVIKSPIFYNRFSAHKGFNYSLSLDFLTTLFDLFDNERDEQNILKPEMERFFKEIQEKIIIKDNEKEKKTRQQK
jgi:hypothetical protein